MKWIHAWLAVMVVTVAGCGAPEVKPPPGAEDTATELEVDISGGDDKPAADSPPADSPKDDAPPPDAPASKIPNENEPPADAGAPSGPDAPSGPGASTSKPE